MPLCYSGGFRALKDCGMICKCGYNFVAEQLACARDVPRISRSYAVVNEERYRKFIEFYVREDEKPCCSTQCDI